MMGRHTRQYAQRHTLLTRQAKATVSLTALVSTAHSWPLMASYDSFGWGGGLHSSSSFIQRTSSFPPSQQHERAFSTTENYLSALAGSEEDSEEDWLSVLPFEDWSHNSVKITIPTIEEEHPTDALHNEVFDNATFLKRLNSTLIALRELSKSSIWIDVPISRSRLIEEMAKVGFRFHHAQGTNAVLNLWLKDSESLVPEFATHHVGVGALVINSREEILCVRELRRNYMPWKIPGGLSELGEHINEAAEREVFEETGIRTTFRNVLCFRHTHGMANGRSDLYFVCRMDPIEEIDENGNFIIPEPIPQEAEIEATAWVPYSEFADMVHGENGHPMISHVLNLHDRGDIIEQEFINSIVPGRKASPIYSSPSIEADEPEKHTHGMANGRSDLYSVCRVDPIEEIDENGNFIIPEPIPQEAEIEAAAWVSKFADMVHGENGHPMISHILTSTIAEISLNKNSSIESFWGRKASPFYSSASIEADEPEK